MIQVKRSTVGLLNFSCLISFLMSWFTDMLCPATCRRSTKQRESPGTTSTTQTMWAVSISSARSPPACSTCWMRRAGKNSNRQFIAFHSCLRIGMKLVLIQLKLFTNLSHIFFHAPAFPMPQMRHYWPNSSSNTGETNTLFPHQSWSLPSSFDTLLGKSNIKSR